MSETRYLYHKGLNYRGFFVCPIEQQNGYTYRCLRSKDDPEVQLGNGIFASITQALEAGQLYLDREWQDRNEISYYQHLLESEKISQDEYYSMESSIDQAIWGLT